MDLLPGLGGPFGPNYDGVLPETRRTSLVSSVDLTYRLAEHSAVGLTGGFQKYSYDSLKTSTGVPYNPFVDAKVITGSAFFSQQVTPSVSAGVQFAYTDIYSTGAEVARTQAPAPMGFVKMEPRPAHHADVLRGSAVCAHAPGGDDRPDQRRGVLTPLVSYLWWHPGLEQGPACVQRERHAAISNGGGVLDAVKAIDAGAAYRARFAQRLLAEVRG